MGYDALGNITSKSDVGTYAYPATGLARPHAVGSITGAINTIFTYDANGNMLAGQGRTVTYTSFNMAASITQGSSIVSLTYDANHARIKQTAPDGTTIYVAGPAGVERFAATSGLVTWNEYLSAGGQMAGVHFSRSDATQNTRHFVTDHLGSVAVLTDEMGTVVERLAYDAWGKRRYPNGADDPAGAITSQTTKGFTGHEHIAAVGLINMNARIYDPTIGRFMTADSFVQDIYLSQLLNRYNYVNNNPLSLTDPSGHFIAELIGIIIVAAILSPIIKEVPIIGSLFVIAASLTCGPGCGAAASAAVTGIQGGDLGDMLKAAVLTYAQAVVFDAVGSLLEIPGTALGLEELDRFVAHGIVGGTFSELQGGDFGSGFLAGGVASLGHGLEFDTIAEGAAFHAVLGGIGSVAAGGKFENGAITGAFGYLFNKRGHFSPGSDAKTGPAPSPEPPSLLEELISAILDLAPSATRVGTVVGLATTLCGDDPRTCTPQYVVRGGTCTAERFCQGSGVFVDSQGILHSVSVQSFPLTSVQTLSQRQWIPYNRIGVTTVDQVRAMGGTVIQTPRLPHNPYHATMSGISAAQAELLFNPTIANPNPR